VFDIVRAVAIIRRRDWKRGCWHAGFAKFEKGIGSASGCLRCLEEKSK